FRPDQLKIYPCQVVEDSPLAKTYKLIKYKPYTQEETKEILSKMMKMIPDYCRVMRIMREFPKEKLIEGLEKLDLRKDIEEEFRNKGLKIREIRMREVGFNQKDLNLNVKIKIIEYNASNGKEFFLEFVNKNDILFGLLRLRISNKIAIIRELHIYGQALNLGEEGFDSQHLGLGKMLMAESEKIVKKNKIKKLKIISGIGVREYYRKLGYKLDKKRIYMVKFL
ncbi:MAG: tRNA uridine(34) 5-carboxymethylaminomethyl modification radical SAM/GNAT enzyme Elp3, partial [Nanoarchaeota archaeon]